jgi:3-oxoacyl-[acyl-carrier protein] reductase
MSKLKNKVAIVTGASKGIGAGIAKLFAAEGASVVVNYALDQAGADKVVDEITRTGGRAIAVKGNVSIAENVAYLFERANQEFGTIDILVNNAGVFSAGPIEEFSEDEYHRIFDTNMLGPLLTCREALKYFINGGSIINIGTNGTRGGWANLSVYAASKAGLDMLTRVLSKEFGSRNIRVNSVNPGATVTEGSQTAFSNEAFVKTLIDQTALGRLGKPEDIARVVSFLASDESSWLTGEVIVASGG